MKRLNSFRLWLYGLWVRLLPETRAFRLKASLLRWCGATIGADVRINSSAVFSGTGALIIGDDVWIGPGCYISPTGDATITIGSHVDLAPQVMLLTGSHEVALEGGHIAGQGTSSPVSIGNGCWLGARTTILPGVELGGKTLTAAGSVVVKSNPRGAVLLAGVPAVVRKDYREGGAV